METELITLLILQTILITVFSKFEIHTAILKRLLKWFIIDGATIALYYWIGHLAMVFIFISLLPGTIYHFFWCKKNGIHPLNATPRKKYYELRGWKID